MQDATSASLTRTPTQVVARGWAQYLLTSMDKLDFVVVLAAVAEELASLAVASSVWETLGPTKEREIDQDDPVMDQVFSVLRVIRIVRLYKLVRDQPQLQDMRALRLALDALFSATKPVIVALCISFCVLMLFALLGMQLFSGGMYQCSDGVCVCVCVCVCLRACLRTSACACMRASMLKLLVSVLAYIRIHTC